VIFWLIARLIIQEVYSSLMDPHKQKEEFLRLIEKNKGIIIKICNSYCYNQHDREDLTQEIIYQLWKSGSRFKSESKFSTWMYRVSLNVAISFYRKQKKTDLHVRLTDSNKEIEDEIHDRGEMEKNLILLQRLIAEMNELDKALTLLYLDDRSHREIAEILGISETNVSTKINRIKFRLKQKILTTINTAHGRD
jgi:RNA polymerase sigma factor (sigma-70 family)